MTVSETHGAGSPVASTSSFTYDPMTSAVATATDGAGKVWTSTYDTSGNRLTTTDPLNRTTTWTYNTFNQPLTVTDAAGVSTTSTYNATGNLVTVSRPLVGASPAQTATTTYTYGDAAHPGDVTTITDPRGKTTTIGYDTYGNTTAVTDPTGRKTTNTFNVIGWKLTAAVLPAGNATGGVPSANTVTLGRSPGSAPPRRHFKTPAARSLSTGMTGTRT